MSSVTPAFQTGHIGLNVNNLERSKQFYQVVFGFTIIGESQQPGRRFAFLSDGQQLVLTLWEQSEGGFVKDRAGLHHLSFSVGSMADVQLFEERLRSLGARFQYEGIVPHSEGGIREEFSLKTPMGYAWKSSAQRVLASMLLQWQRLPPVVFFKGSASCKEPERI